MAQFSSTQWNSIKQALDGNESGYGLPERREKSLVFASFNIRKFGKLNKGNTTKRSSGSWDLLVRFCERCDLIGIQEVLDNTSSLKHLVSRLGPKYSLAVSDIAGGVPGKSGNKERLAFVYRNDRLAQTGLGADISFERSEILNTLYDNRDDFLDAFKQRVVQLDAWEAKNIVRLAAGKRKSPKPPFVLPEFIQFIRTPHIVSFEALGAAGAEPYRFMAVNAHLLYGDKSKQKNERELEFKALLDWLITRGCELDRAFEPNILLFGDLNLDFKKTDIRREAIAAFLKTLNTKKLNKSGKINLPFLDVHPAQGEVYRTNARRNQTYDQIAIIASDKRLPPPHQNDEAGEENDRFDFGMFDFVRLFLDALPEATKSNGKPNYSLFEFDVSDHMPIWIRLEQPKVGQHEFRWR